MHVEPSSQPSDPWQTAIDSGYDSKPASPSFDTSVWDDYLRDRQNRKGVSDTFQSGTADETDTGASSSTTHTSRPNDDLLKLLGCPSEPNESSKSANENVFSSSPTSSHTQDGEQKTSLKTLADLLGDKHVARVKPPSTFRIDTGGEEEDEHADHSEWLETIAKTQKGRTTFYPTYQWDEEDECEIQQSSGQPQVGSRIATRVSTSYGHTMTRNPGKEGLLPDTGAVSSLTGSRFVRVQGAIAEKHGHHIECFELAKPKRVGGVGGQNTNMRS